MTTMVETIVESAALTSFRTQGRLDLADLIRLLNHAKIRFVLVGATGMAGWLRRVEAVREIDVIVAQKHRGLAIERLSEAYSDWTWRDSITQLQLATPNKDGAIRLMKPMHNLECAVFKHTRTVRIAGQACRIPSLEMAMAMKFRDAVCIYQNEESRVLQVHEFYRLANLHPRRNEAVLASLAEMVFVTGERSIRKMIRIAATPAVV